MRDIDASWMLDSGLNPTALSWMPWELQRQVTYGWNITQMGNLPNT
jgi:hypothetical protein